MSKKQELNDTLSSPKYRCCCGCMHVKTATKLCCIILIISFFLDIRKYFGNTENDDWEAIKIIFGFVTAVSPWIGIDKKKSTYFFPSFLGYAIRVVSASITIVSLMFYDYFPTSSANKIRGIYNDLNSSEFDRLNKIFPFAPFCFFVAFLFILLEIRIFFVFYKCYQYIAITSTQDENKQALVKVKKRRNVNLLKSNDTKETLTKVPPNTRNRISESVIAVLSPFSKLYKNLAHFKYKEHPKMKMATDKIAEREKALLKLKIHEESIGELKTTETINDINSSTQEECYFEIKLANHRIQSESVNFIVKSKKTKIIKKVIKPSCSPKKGISKLRRNLSSPDQNSFKSIKSISQQSSEEKLSNVTTSKIKNLSLQETTLLKTTTSEKLPVQHFKNTITEIPEHSLLQEKPSLYSTISEPPSEQYSSILSTLSKLPEKNNSKPKNLVNIEIQTNETSFDPRMNKRFYRWQQHNIDTSNDSFSHIQYSDNNPQFSSASVQHSSRVTSSGFSSISDAYLDCSPFQSLSPYPEKAATKVTFLFKNDETCAIEIYQNGRNKKLKNIFENEWTPLYFSMAQKTPEIGEKAQIHLHKFREHVLYDIFKIIGKPINEIILQEDWKFKIVEENGIKCFQIRTQKGPRLYPETSIIAAFLKSMKLQTENYMNFEINEINLCSNFVFSEAQKRIFKNASEKLDVKILSFYVNDLD